MNQQFVMHMFISDLSTAIFTNKPVKEVFDAYEQTFRVCAEPSSDNDRSDSEVQGENLNGSTEVQDNQAG
jgi:hypothetical protein